MNGRTDSSEPGGRYMQLAQENGWVGICDPKLSFRARELSELHDLWRQTARASAIPRRCDFTPRVLKSCLPHVAIYERVLCPQKGRRYRVRLMGTRFAQVMGDLTGKFIDEAVPAPFLPRWYAALDAVIEACVPLRFLSRADTVNKSFLLGEFFEAPLLNDNGEAELVLAAAIHTEMQDWDEILAEERERSAA